MKPSDEAKRVVKEILTGFSWWNYGLDEVGIAESDEWAQFLAAELVEKLSLQTTFEHLCLLATNKANEENAFLQPQLKKVHDALKQLERQSRNSRLPSMALAYRDAAKLLEPLLASNKD